MHERCRHCHGCGGDRSAPEPETKIRELAPGDSVLIRRGYGVPAAERDFEAIVADVDGNSFMTCDGTRVDCAHVTGFEKLDRPKAEVKLSERARQVMAETAPAATRTPAHQRTR